MIVTSMNPNYGGICQGIRNSVPAHKEMGIDSEVVCFDNPQSDYIKNESFIIHALGEGRGPYSYNKNLKPWLEKNISRFEVVIIHGLWQHTTYGTFKAWHSLKKKNLKLPKLYIMPHGMLDPYFQRAKNRRLKAVRNWFFWKLIEARVVNAADGILFTCEEELFLARKTFKPYKPKAEINVGFGIELPPHFRKEFQDAFLEKCPDLKDKSYWLFLSRIHPKKGVDLLINAYLRLKKRYSNLPALVIAGPGLETYYGIKLQKSINGNEVYLPGMLKGDAKWGAFYGCDAFILPSHQENFGIAVVEAMACKKPVLISNQVNIWREIEKGEGGVVYNDTEDGIFQTLESWISQSEKYRISTGENAARIYEEKYTIQKAAANMISCIQ